MTETERKAERQRETEPVLAITMKIKIMLILKLKLQKRKQKRTKCSYDMQERLLSIRIIHKYSKRDTRRCNKGGRDSHLNYV